MKRFTTTFTTALALFTTSLAAAPTCSCDYDPLNGVIVSRVTNVVSTPTPTPVVTPTPTPTPTPVVTPTPTPVAGQPIEGGTGKPSAVPSDAKLIQPGADLGDLSGKVKLAAGEYKATKPLKDNVEIYSDGVHAAVLKLADKKQLTGGVGVKLYGLTIRGGGLGKYNHEAAVITNDRWYLEDVLVEKSIGTGINIQGSNIKSVRLIAQDNAASGRGMKVKGDKPGDGYYELDAIVRRNNRILKDGDGASKATKSTGVLIENLHTYENMGRGLWFDCRNSEILVKGGAFHSNRTKDQKDYSYGGGLYYEYNAGPASDCGPGKIVVDGAWFYDNDGIGFTIAESENVEVKNCVFKKNVKAPSTSKKNHELWGIAFRNIGRAGGNNLVKNVNIHDNRFEDGTGVYNSDTTVKKGANKITIEHNTWVNGENDNIAD